MKKLKLFCGVLEFYYRFYINIEFKKKQRNHIVVLNHFFNQDISSLKNANNEFKITVISAFTFNRVFRQFIQYTKDEWSSINDEVNISKRVDYAIFFKKWILPIFLRFKVNVFLTPSDQYPYLRDIIPLFRKEKIINIVIDKEGTITPYDFIEFSGSIKKYNPFISDLIIVWNNRQKLFWKKCGIKNDSIIHVLGQARSDFWFTEQKPSRILLKSMPKNKINVLFFSFDKHYYIPEHMFESGEITWNLLYRESHLGIVSCAKKYPHINFVIKTHPQQCSLDKEILSIINELDNVSIIGGAKLSNELILNSHIVIGFQTTALIEAMLCGKPIIYTYWGDAPKIADFLIPFHLSDSLWVAKSLKEFDNIFEKCLSNLQVPDNHVEARKIFVEKYFHNCNGKTSERILDLIFESIHES
jgi:hypothetical protein